MARPWSSSARVLNMSTHRITQILAALAMLALPALAAAPIDSAFATGMRRASTPMVDIRHARVIVKFKADGALMRESALSARDPDRAIVQHAARLSQRLGIALRDGHMIAPRTQVLHANDMSSAALVARLQADPDVEYAEVDERMRITAVPNDFLYGNQVGLVTPAAGQWYMRPPTAQFVSSINAEAAWDTTTGSPAIVVADLDTGVRPDHPDLVGKLVPGYDFVSADSPGDFTSSNDGDGRDADASDPGDWVTQQEVDGVFAGQGCSVTDSSWHGTQTAALIGAATNNAFGMASVGRNVRVMPVRVLGKCGGFMSDVIAGMYWAAGINIPSTFGTGPVNPFPAKILNMSLGSATTTCGAPYQTAVNAVVGAGASVVISAGNDAGLAVGQPANCAGAIGVGGLRHTGTKVGFSDVGPEIAISSPGGNCVNQNPGDPCLFPILTATNTGTTTPGASAFSDSFNISVGTSFSAPLVSGAAALMLSVNPTLTPAQVRSTLRATARAFPTTGGTAGTVMCQPPTTTQQLECYCTTSTCGAGMLDVRAAVLAVPAPTSTQALAFATPAAPTPGATITLDGTTSVPAAGQTINSTTGYKWTMVNSGNIASLVGVNPVISPTATVTTTGEGQFIVQLEVTDSGNAKTTTQLTVNVANPVVPSGNPTNPSGGGGGGSLSWPWLLGLCVAVASLRPRRR
jgi:serine protease